MPADPIVPPGKLHSTITYLEMPAPPAGNSPPAPSHDAAIRAVADPTVAFYRFLYNTVGEPWLWSDRRKLTDTALAAIIGDPRVTLHVLYVGNQPAGYAELDGRRQGEIELAYFGLLPDFTGRGLGPWLLRHAIDQAWSQPIGRLWVHTCTLDHPAALGMYQKSGFVPYKQETEIADDPRALGLIPQHAAPHVPIVT